MTQLLATITTEKFQSAEQLWFWFLYSKSVQNDVLRRRGGANTPALRNTGRGNADY